MPSLVEDSSTWVPDSQAYLHGDARSVAFEGISRSGSVYNAPSISIPRTKSIARHSSYVSHHARRPDATVCRISDSFEKISGELGPGCLEAMAPLQYSFLISIVATRQYSLHPCTTHFVTYRYTLVVYFTDPRDIIYLWLIKKERIKENLNSLFVSTTVRSVV